MGVVVLKNTAINPQWTANICLEFCSSFSLEVCKSLEPQTWPLSHPKTMVHIYLHTLSWQLEHVTSFLVKSDPDPFLAQDYNQTQGSTVRTHQSAQHVGPILTVYPLVPLRQVKSHYHRVVQ